MANSPTPVSIKNNEELEDILFGRPARQVGSETSSRHLPCPKCRTDVYTTPVTVPSYVAYISGICISVLGCSCGCCFLPCYMEQCRIVKHKCPRCGKNLT